MYTLKDAILIISSGVLYAERVDGLFTEDSRATIGGEFLQTSYVRLAGGQWVDNYLDQALDKFESEWRVDHTTVDSPEFWTAYENYLDTVVIPSLINFFNQVR